MSGKLEDIEFRGIEKGRIQPLVDFKDRVREIFNGGNVQFSVVSTPPTFDGDPGQIVFYQVGTAGRLYGYVGTGWILMLSFTV